MAKDTGMMAHDTMGKGAMMKDSRGMDKMGMDHDQMGMEKDKVGMEKMAGEMGMAAPGTMMGTGGHKVTGSVTVTEADGKSEVRLGDDFSVPSAKDLEVVLSRSPNGPPDEVVKLGKLKKAKGAQSYPIPGGTSVSEFSHLVLRSTKDQALVATASLAPMGDAMHK
jgi:hypothetical protein